MAKHQRKALKKRDGRVNAWMASQKMQKDPRGFRKPGSLRRS